VTTGTDVVNSMALDASVLADDVANLKAVNYGVATSWPFWRMTEQAAGGTLASTTYTYSLAALTTIDRATGVANVHVIPTSYPPVNISYRCRQYYDQSAAAWTLQIDKDITGEYNTYPFYVEYQYPHPTLTAIGQTVYAPISAVARVALEWMAMYGATSQNSANDFWKAFGAEYLRPESVWMRNESQHLVVTVPIGRGHV